MKKKFNIKLLSLPVSLLATIMLSSCGNHNAIGPVTPIKSNIKPVKQVYMPSAQNNPISKNILIFNKSYTYHYGAAYNGTNGPAKAPTDISVKFSVNPTMVDSFNNENSSSYKILPKSSYKLSKTTAAISAGEMNTPQFKLTINPEKGKLKEQEYVLPISIQASGDDVKINQNLRTTYFVINSIFPKIFLPQSKNNPIKNNISIIDTTYTYGYRGIFNGTIGPAKAPFKIDVKFSANPSLVNSYNSKNSTSYLALPKGSYTLSKTSADISAGDSSTAQFKLKINPKKGNIKDRHYLLPITIQPKTSGVKVINGLQTAYFIFNSNYRPISKTGWSASVNSELNIYYGANYIIDGDDNSFWLTVDSLPYIFTIDMGESHTLHGFTLVGHTYSGNLNFINRNPKKVTFKFSNNGTIWKNPENFTLPFVSDSSSKVSAKVDLAEPVKARYFKFIINTTVGGQGVGNFNEIYAF
jgi:hypothetical protein